MKEKSLNEDRRKFLPLSESEKNDHKVTITVKLIRLLVGRKIG